MFKKAQMKVFAIITGILILLFIAVLGSINLIMRSVMQRQSIELLGQIAAGVEYDDKTSLFTFRNHGGFNKEHDFHYDTTTESTTTTTTPPTTERTTATLETTTLTTTTSTTTTTTTINNTTPTTAPTTSQTTTTVPPTTTTTTTVKPSSAATQTTTTTTQYVPPFTTTEGQFPTYPPYDPGQNPWDPGNNGGENPPWGQDYWNNWYFWNSWYYWNNWYNWNGAQSKEPETTAESTTAAEISSGEETTTAQSGFVREREAREMSLTEELYGTPALLGNTVPEKPDLGDMNGDDYVDQPLEKGEPVPKAIGSIDFFVVMADKSGNYLSVLNNNELASDTAQNYIDTIMKKEVRSGMMNNLQYHRENKNNGTLIVFTDKSAELDMLNKLLKTTIVIGSISVILLSIAAFFLSKKIMQPLKIAFDKQKQFISDASHELKTPLTVISANADVLSGEIGENKWLTYIQSQTDRMSILVNDLLNLTRLENNTSQFIRRDFDLSKAVISTALPFECHAFEMNKKFEVDVEDNIFVNGSEQHIKQMTAIFIDNALKYSDENGTIRVTLKKIGDRKFLSVYNSGKGISEAEKTKIFERFYRSDESRNRSTGGYGLGLAIAKSIIDRHRFKIHIQTDPGRSVSFIVIM